jgi:glycosyltransferase involved in cell wall biosynthesis
VTQIGYAPTLQDYVDWTATMDVAVNLRYPTLGETSASALRAMDVGRALIVYDHGWYAELPAEAVVKLPPEPDETALRDAMRALSQDPARRQMMGRAAAAYVADVCHPEAVSQAYVDYLNGLREEWRHGP